MNLVNLTGARLVLLSIPASTDPKAPPRDPEELVLEAEQEALTIETSIEPASTSNGDGTGVPIARVVPRAIKNLPKLPQSGTLFIVTEEVFRLLAPRPGIAYPDPTTALRTPQGAIRAYRQLIAR